MATFPVMYIPKFAFLLALIPTAAGVRPLFAAHGERAGYVDMPPPCPPAPTECGGGAPAWDTWQLTWGSPAHQPPQPPPETVVLVNRPLAPEWPLNTSNQTNATAPKRILVDDLYELVANRTGIDTFHFTLVAGGRVLTRGTRVRLSEHHTVYQTGRLLDGMKAVANPSTG